jgi:hypothetical protein
VIYHLTRASSQKNNGEVHSHIRCLVEKLLCPKGGKFGLTTCALCAVLADQDTLQSAFANPHGHATTRPAGWHHNIADFAAADGENHG